MDCDAVLVLNAGSSSLKFTVFRSPPAANHEVAVSGRIESIGRTPRFLARCAAGQPWIDVPLHATVANVRDAMRVLSEWLVGRFANTRVVAVGHRVVHGGTHYQQPIRVDDQVMKDLRALTPLAPLHQPHNLDTIEAVAGFLPEAPQVACFDTSFHRGKPAVAELVPLPARIRAGGVQRYGFHGLSYEYIASILPRVAPHLAARRVIVAHLGNGASLCALSGGKSIDCTLGYTALDGLCMGTRPGAIDPGVILHLFQELALSVSQVESILYHESGLLGISGISNDMRELLADPAPAAKLAIDYFVYRAAQEIGALTASLGGLDGLVFTAGIGENAAEIRRRICQASAWLGVELDDAANGRGGPCISVPGGKVSAWVLPTNEELVIARHTTALLGMT